MSVCMLGDPEKKSFFTACANLHCVFIIKGEYLVRNTTNIRTDGIFCDLKLHVSAFIGHLQVSTVLRAVYICCKNYAGFVDLEISKSTNQHNFYSIYRLLL